MNYNAGVHTPNPTGGYINNFNNPNPMQYMPPQMQPNGQMPMQQANTQMQQQQPVQPQSQPQMAIPPQTNKILVPSWEAARDRTVPFNSECVYFHQDADFGFEVYTDPQGRKDVKPFRIVPCTIEEMENEIKGVKTSDLAGFATKKDLEEFESKIVQYIKQNKQELPPLVKPKLHTEKANDDLVDDIGDK